MLNSFMNLSEVPVTINDPTLPAIPVYGSNADPYWGLGPYLTGYGYSETAHGPFDPVRTFENNMPNSLGVHNAAKTGNPLLCLEEYFKGLSGRSLPFVEGNIKGWGGFTHWVADGNYRYVQGLGPWGISIPGSESAVLLADLYAGQVLTSPPRPSPDFYSTVFMPISAIWFWAFGGGQTRYMAIESLGLSFLQPTDFQPVAALISDAVNYGPGVYSINENTSYNTFNGPISLLPIAGTIGRVGINVTGQLTIDSSGNWSFTGDFGVLPDRYDADTATNRVWYQEALTSFLLTIGSIFPSTTDYDIEFIGRQPISGSGVR